MLFSYAKKRYEFLISFSLCCPFPKCIKGDGDLSVMVPTLSRRAHFKWDRSKQHERAALSVQETLAFVQIKGSYGKRAWEQGDDWKHKPNHSFIPAHIY